MASYIYISKTDKIVSSTGNKVDVILSGQKELNYLLLGSSSIIAYITGNINVNFSTPSDKIVNLLGNNIVSLSGLKSSAKIIGDEILIGQQSTTVNLVGEAPLALFYILCDNGYVTNDIDTVTCDFY